VIKGMATRVTTGISSTILTAKGISKSSSVWKYILHPRKPNKPPIKKANKGDFFDLSTGR
jgi:hypothetical protein